MNKKVNWGIIGLGKIANKFAADLQLSNKAVLYGVASRDINKAKSFGKKFSSITSFGSYHELADDPNIDVVYIATPHTYHFENTMMCLRKNKHVLCEKPMGLNTKEVEIMIAEAKSRKLFLMEGIWTRFIPGIEKLLDLLSKNSIGNILSLHADFGFKAEVDFQKRLYNKELGGGSLLDIGIYPIYLSIITMGLPKDIAATAQMTETGVDNSCSMEFIYENKSKASLESSIESKTPTEAYIKGSNGSIKLHSRFHHTEKITISRDATTEILDIKYNGQGYIHEIEEVNTCILNQETESSKLPLKTSLDLISIIDKVKEKIGLTYDLKDF